MAPRIAGTRRGRWLAAGLLAVLLVGIGIAVGEATGWPVLRGPLENHASRAAQVPVQLGGHFQLRLLGPPRLQVGQLTVGAAQGVEAPHLLQAEDALLAWRWGDLWRWRQGAPLRIRALTARTLDLRLLRLADGRASWALGAGKSASTPDTPDPPDLPRFGRLQVNAGHVVVDDALLDTALRIDLAGGEGDAAAPDAAGYRADIRGRWRALPLQLTARMGGGAVALLHDDADGAEAPVLPLRVEGTAGAARLVFDGRTAALLGARHLDGALRFSGPSLAAVGAPLGVTLPRTPAFQLEGRLAHDDGVWQLRADSATIGSSALGGDFRFDSRANPRLLSGRLTGSRLVLADLGPAVGTQGEGRDGATAPPPSPGPGRLLPQRRFDLPSLRAMDADVAVLIDVLDLGSQALAPLQAVRTRLLLQGGVLQLQGLQAGVAGGQVAGNTRLDGRGEPARWDLDLRVSGIDMAGWVRALQSPDGAARPGRRSKAELTREREAARQGDQPVRSYLTGLLGGHAQLHGQGRSTAQILATLQGRVQLQLHEGTVSHLVTEAAGVDLAQVLGVMVRGDQPLPLRCAIVELAVEQGVASVRRGVLDNADSTLRLDGRIDLRSESLALRARARPKDFSPLTLRAPLLVTGTLAEPVVGLDGRALGGRAAAAAALAVIAAPAAALLALVDPGQDETADPCADPVPAPAKR
jgi:AsmA family protein